MKRNIERKYIWNFLKASVVIGVALALLMPGSAAVANYGKTAKVQASVNTIVASTTRDIIYVDAIIFTIENPPVDFEVVDADPFDGFGDNGPYSTFNDALLGTLGECRSMAEFDISPFSVPPGEYISAATFEVMITEIDVFGLGVNGETPESLTVDGYVGNGLEELSDFEAGDGNVLDSVATPDPQIGQVLSFDVTSFVTDLVNAQEQYVGLTIRAETFGGLWVTEGGVFPKLTIETYTANLPPDAPEIDGETTGAAGEEYEYTFVATDPEEDDISYFVDWGDDTTTGWTDFVASGEEVALTHTWDEQGTYTIRAKAKDTFDAESEWGILEVTIAPEIPELEVTISGGFGLTVSIENVGTTDAEDVPVEIVAEGGLILVGANTSKTVDIPVGQSVDVKVFMIGIGNVTIAVTVDDLDQVEVSGLLLLVFLLGLV